jgi:DinB superfamily
MPYEKTIQVVRQGLLETLVELETWFEQSEERRSYWPQDGGWSIQAILEHITLTNHYLLLIIRQGQEKALRRARRGESVDEGESDLGRLTPIGHPDAFPWIRPEHMEPTGASLENVHARLHTQYQECLTILAALGNGEGSLYTVRMSVQNLGKMDMYQWLYFLVLHQRRHIAQMEQVLQEWQRD